MAPEEAFGNLLMIKLSAAISTDAAEQYVRNGPLPKSPKVAAAFLFRTRVCANGTDIGLGHEFRIVRNSGAAIGLAHYSLSSSLRFELLTGVLPHAAPLEDKPDVSPFMPAFPHSHGFHRQHHHYSRLLRNGSRR